MGSALLSTLPYAIAVVASPVSAMVVIALLVSARGSHKALMFAGVCFVVCGLVPLSLAPLVRAVDPDRPHLLAAWIHLLLGLALLAGAVLLVVRRRRRLTPPTAPPGWLSAVDRMGLGSVAFLAVGLNTVNPVNLAALLAAAAALGRHGLGFAGNAVVAVLFALICSASVITPIAVVLRSGSDGEERLSRMRTWLVRHNDDIQILTSVVFGAVLALNGLRTVLA